MVCVKTQTLMINARLTYNIIARNPHTRLENESSQEERERVSQKNDWCVPVNESSPASTPVSWIRYPAKGPASETSQTNHLLRCHLSAVRSWIMCTKYNQDATARCLVMSLLHEMIAKEAHSEKLAKVSRNSDKCKTDRCNPRNWMYDSKCK